MESRVFCLPGKAGIQYERMCLPLRIVKKIWDIISTVIVVLVVCAAVFLMGSRLVGLQVFNVISGSMEPTYSVGDLLYVNTKTAPESVKPGDVITFVLNEDLVVATHRVTRVDAENQRFYTQGDANEHEDVSPVLFKNMVGTPVFSIPLLGYVSAWIQKPPGMYIAIGGGVLLLATVFLPDLFLKKKPKSESAPEAPEIKQEEDA